MHAEEAKAAALAFLRQREVQCPPVPVKKLIKELGWLYFFLNSQNPDFIDEEGFSIHESGMYYIYINADLPTGRDNFTYAHETAHIVLRHHLKYDVDSLDEHDLWLIDRETNIWRLLKL